MIVNTDTDGKLSNLPLILAAAKEEIKEIGKGEQEDEEMNEADKDEYERTKKKYQLAAWKLWLKAQLKKEEREKEQKE
eukprot:gene10450-3210_t